MKILFIGNHSISFSTETHHRKTFEKLGHEVITFQENQSSVDAVMKHIDEADMLYFTHTHSYQFDTPEKIRYMFSEFKKKGIPSVGYHLDLWMGLEREKDLHSDPYWGIQHFFTADKLMADWLNENTKTKGYFLPAGCFEDESYMAEPNYEKYPHEIIFTGSKGYHPEWPYRPKLIDWLQKTYGDRFAHYGGGGKPTVRGHELNVLYASAKISIGDTLCNDFSYKWYTSDRLFESCGRGAFLIYPRIHGLEFFYEDKKEVVYYDFNNFEQLKELIDYYLIHTEEREKIRAAGHHRTKEAHTYRHRLSQLLSTLENERV